MDKELVHRLKLAVHDELGQMGYPQMPRNFHQRVSIRVGELARETQFRIISLSEAFLKAREFAITEYSRIYPFED